MKTDEIAVTYFHCGDGRWVPYPDVFNRLSPAQKQQLKQQILGNRHFTENNEDDLVVWIKC